MINFGQLKQHQTIGIIFLIVGNEASDTQKHQIDIQVKGNVSYEVPLSRIKMKENVSYEVPPSQIRTTQNEAYGPLLMANKPQVRISRLNIQRVDMILNGLTYKTKLLKLQNQVHCLATVVTTVADKPNDSSYGSFSRDRSPNNLTNLGKYTNNLQNICEGSHYNYISKLQYKEVSIGDSLTKGSVVRMCSIMVV